MADPITIIGAVGALCNIIQVVGKTIITINTLRVAWKDGDLVFLSLASQVVALRAALTKIQEWVDAEAGETHHQLTMDLDISIACCKVLVDRMDAVFSDLHHPVTQPLDMLAKLRVTFGTGGIDELQKLVARQTSALTLLLTACNCKAISEQKQVLEKPKTRKTLERAKADSASLIVHRDDTSLVSRWTDNMSKISVTFDFDRLVFSSRVYERVFRSSLRDGLRRQRERSTVQDVGTDLSDSGGGMTAWNSPWIPALAARFRDGDLPMVVEPLRKRLAANSITFQTHGKNLRHVCLMGGCGGDSKDMVTAYFHEAWKTQKPSRETLLDYPTCKATFHLGEHEYLMYNYFGTGAWSTSLIHYYMVPIVVFVVDLYSYDQPVLPGPFTVLTQSLLRFRYWASLEEFKRSRVLLLFSCDEAFTVKLETSPLQRYFLDYSEGADASKAKSYIENRFLDPRSMLDPGRVTVGYFDIRGDVVGVVRSFLEGIPSSALYVED